METRRAVPGKPGITGDREITLEKMGTAPGGVLAERRDLRTPSIAKYTGLRFYPRGLRHPCEAEVGPDYEDALSISEECS